MARNFEPEVEARLRADAADIIARYPDSRSAVMPILHLIQSEESFVSPRGIVLAADVLGLSRAEISAVATFYSQYRRHPNGEYNVGVCTNALCAVMGGDDIFDAVSTHLGLGNDETTPGGEVTLERIECNAACDFAPVMMVNWEFFDNMDPAKTDELLTKLLADDEVVSPRGATLTSWRGAERVLAGFPDGRADEGPSAGPASVLGRTIAAENNWTAPSASAGSVLTEREDTK